MSMRAEVHIFSTRYTRIDEDLRDFNTDFQGQTLYNPHRPACSSTFVSLITRFLDCVVAGTRISDLRHSLGPLKFFVTQRLIAARSKGLQVL